MSSHPGPEPVGADRSLEAFLAGLVDAPVERLQAILGVDRRESDPVDGIVETTEVRIVLRRTNRSRQAARAAHLAQQLVADRCRSARLEDEALVRRLRRAAADGAARIVASPPTAPALISA